MRVSSRAILTFSAISIPCRSRMIIAEYSFPPEPVPPFRVYVERIRIDYAVPTREPHFSNRFAGETGFCVFCPLGRAAGWPLLNVRARDRGRSSLGGFGPSLRLVGYLAIGHQHRDDHCHLPDGVRDSEHPNPRYAGDAAETG